MSKLFSRAYVFYKNAEFDYIHIYEDDCYLDLCCFQLQQTIEFLLKGIVEIHGIKYAENHAIRANLNIMNREGIQIPCEKELRDKSELLYKWETESRYKDSFIAAVRDIEEIMSYAKALFSYVESIVSVRHPVEVDFPNKRLSD